MTRELVRAAVLAGLAWALAAGCADQVERDESGAIVSGGRLAFDDMEVGDCVDDYTIDFGEAAELEAQPCDEPHDAELVAIVEPQPAMISEAERAGRIEARCVAALDDLASSLSVYFYVPGSSRPDADGRGYCLAEAADGSKLEAPLGE